MGSGSVIGSKNREIFLKKGFFSFLAKIKEKCHVRSIKNLISKAQTSLCFEKLKGFIIRTPFFSDLGHLAIQRVYICDLKILAYL